MTFTDTSQELKVDSLYIMRKQPRNRQAHRLYVIPLLLSAFDVTTCPLVPSE